MLPAAKNGKVLLILWFISLLFVTPPRTCGAVPNQSDPMALVKDGTERALRILHESQSGNAAPLRQRKIEILGIVSEYFNFDEMAKRALGRPWKDQPADKRKEFSQLFRQLLFNTYINRLEKYTGSNERVSYDPAKLDGDYALVKTHIFTQGTVVELDYRLHLDGGRWQVYDVAVEGVSFVENYRSQFSSILTNESFDSLLKRLREKVDRTS